MLHEWRSRIAATTSAINYLILSKAQEMVFSLKAYLSPNTYYNYNLMVNRISKYLKILDWDLKISWFRTLMLYFVVFRFSSPSIYSYYTFHKKKKLFNFLYTTNALRRLHTSDEWRVKITFFCDHFVQALASVTTSMVPNQEMQMLRDIN